MLGHNPSEPSLFQLMDVGSLVPANHQLRKIDAVLDFHDPVPVPEPPASSPGEAANARRLALRVKPVSSTAS